MNNKGFNLGRLLELPATLLMIIPIFFVVQVFGQIVIDNFNSGVLSSPYQGFIIALVGFLGVAVLWGAAKRLLIDDRDFRIQQQ